jgi:hypothetical protein
LRQFAAKNFQTAENLREIFSRLLSRARGWNESGDLVCIDPFHCSGELTPSSPHTYAAVAVVALEELLC